MSKTNYQNYLQKKIAEGYQILHHIVEKLK